MGRASDPRESVEDRKYQASKRAAANMLSTLGVRVEQLSRYIDDPHDGETWITSIQFKMNHGYDGSVLAIVKCTQGGAKVVGFHSDESFHETVSGLGARLMNGTMKWREDKPYEPDTGK